MGSGSLKEHAGDESPSSDSGSESSNTSGVGSSRKKSGGPARWPLGLAAIAWLAWVGFLVAMLMAQRGGLGSS